MGLGAPKRRKRLSHDPNNTKWSKSTDTYGHKVLSAQGWKPGDYLGASDANHSDHYTAANASHIRVLLREANLGLGAQIGKTNAETFGLSLFSRVLGRLNGKSDEEVQKQQNALRDAELRTYQAQKYGLVKFVRGGFLVGDRIQSALGPKDDGVEEPLNKRLIGKAGRKDRKRKAQEEGSDSTPGGKAKKRRKALTEADEEDLIDETKAESTKSYKNKKKEHGLKWLNEDTKQDESEMGEAGTGSHLPEASSTIGITPTLADNKQSTPKRREKKKTKSGDPDVVNDEVTEKSRSLRKQEKRARKEDRRKRKEEKDRTDAEKDAPRPDTSHHQDQSSTSANSTPVQSHSPFSGGRQALRHRHIQQKRMALDPQAMTEIFMLNAAAA